MKKCHYYLLVEPLLQKYVDNEDIKPMFTIPIKTESKEYEISVFGNDKIIHFVRITIPNLIEDKIPEDDLESILSFKTHMQSVLRLTYDVEVSISPFRLWIFEESGKKYNFNINVDDSLNKNFRVNYDNIKNTFLNSIPFKHQLKLLSDAQDTRIPMQYRYLSLYKLLELEFKRRGKWVQSDFSEFLSNFEAEFSELKKPRKLKSHIHYIRDMCAHIKNNKDVFGVTGLSMREVKEVGEFLPVMNKICATLINKIHGKNLIRIIGLVMRLEKIEQKDMLK